MKGSAQNVRFLSGQILDTPFAWTPSGGIFPIGLRRNSLMLNVFRTCQKRLGN